MVFTSVGFYRNHAFDTFTINSCIHPCYTVYCNVIIIIIIIIIIAFCYYYYYYYYYYYCYFFLRFTDNNVALLEHLFNKLL